MSKKIKTFSTNEFLDSFMNPEPELYQLIKQDYARFFIVQVQDLIKLSKLPVPPARADNHIIIFLTGGVATMNIGFQRTEIAKNECLIIPAGKVFSYEKHDVNTGFICIFDNDFLVGKFGSNELLKEFDFLNIWGNPFVKLDSKTATNMAQALGRILEEYNESGLKNANIIQSYFVAALCELQLIYKPTTSSNSKAAIELTNRFKALLHLHIRKIHLVADYASMLNVSPNHLSKSVKEVTQKPVTKWIDETLVLEAKVLLFQTDSSINEIAFGLGINDPSYFTRLFKKYEGVSPTEYRKLIKMS